MNTKTIDDGCCLKEGYESLALFRKEVTKKIIKTTVELLFFLILAIWMSTYFLSGMSGIPQHEILTYTEGFWGLYLFTSIFFSMILGFYYLLLGAIHTELKQ